MSTARTLRSWGPKACRWRAKPRTTTAVADTGATTLASAHQQLQPCDQSPVRPGQRTTGKAGQTSSYPLLTAESTTRAPDKSADPAHPSGGGGNRITPTDPGVAASRHRALVLLVTRSTKPRESISSARTCGDIVRRSPANTRWPLSRPVIVCSSCGSSAPGRH